MKDIFSEFNHEADFIFVNIHDQTMKQTCR